MGCLKAAFRVAVARKRTRCRLDAAWLHRGRGRDLVERGETLYCRELDSVPHLIRRATNVPNRSVMLAVSYQHRFSMWLVHAIRYLELVS